MKNLSRLITFTICVITISCQAFATALPDGYTELQYVTNASDTYVNTGIIPDTDDIEMEILFTALSGSFYLFFSRQGNTVTDKIWGITGRYANNTLEAYFDTHTIGGATSRITRIVGNLYYAKANFANGQTTFFVQDKTNNTNDIITKSHTTQLPTTPFGLFGNPGGSNRMSKGVRIYYARMKVSGNYVMNYIPARRDSDDEIGFYDMVSNTFKTASSGSLIAGPEIPKIPTTSYVQGMYEAIDRKKQDKLGPHNVVTVGAPYGLVSSIKAENGIITVTKSEPLIRDLSPDSETGYSNIWVE